MNEKKIKILKPTDQGYGEFDNGKITEIKPIDFPGGTGKGKRIGPLFYWSWASANGDGVIGMHPHQAFEIISYGLVGEIGHSDSLKNKTRVGPGGAQLIQAGSGIYHQEEMFGERTDFFQIWFEPELRKTINHKPFYGQYENEEFPVSESEGVKVKHVIGNSSPIKIEAEILADDIMIQPNKSYVLKLAAGKALAISVISGSGSIIVNETEYQIENKYYINVFGDESEKVELKSSAYSNLRVFLIETPTSVEYPLYGEK